MHKIHRYLAFGVLLLASTAPVSGQSVRAGIDSWQKSDYAAAVAIWRPLAESGDADAQFNLGQAYRLGRGVTINLAVAKTWFERAAARGHVDAETTLGLLLFQSGDQAEGLKWLGKAAEKGESRALLIYGTALVNGDSVPQDPILGYAYVSRAAAQGLAAAKETLTQLDRILPLSDRKKGVALAKAKAKAAPALGAKSPRKIAAKPALAKSALAKSALAKSASAPPARSEPAPATAAAVAKRSAANPTPASTKASGNWRIQLGAFAQKGAAQALFAKVSGSLGGRQAYYIPVGGMTRLQVGPFSGRAEASAACARLKGQACFPVAAK